MFFAKFKIYFDTVWQLFCCLLLFSDILCLRRMFPENSERADLISTRVDYPYISINVYRKIRQLFGHCSAIFFCLMLFSDIPCLKWMFLENCERADSICLRVEYSYMLINVFREVRNLI